MSRLFAASRAVLALLSVLVLVAPAVAADVTFVMNNHHPNAVEVELYSQDRDYVWPGNDEVYLLDDGETKTMSLECEEGESICYGAWIQGDQNTYLGRRPGQFAEMRQLLLHLHRRPDRADQPGAVDKTQFLAPAKRGRGCRA